MVCLVPTVKLESQYFKGTNLQLIPTVIINYFTIFANNIAQYLTGG